jgi:hypothetical protein
MYPALLSPTNRRADRCGRRFQQTVATERGFLRAAPLVRCVARVPWSRLIQINASVAGHATRVNVRRRRALTRRPRTCNGSLRGTERLRQPVVVKISMLLVFALQQPWDHERHGPPFDTAITAFDMIRRASLPRRSSNGDPARLDASTSCIDNPPVHRRSGRDGIRASH